jgi:O-antigen ligase
MYNLCMFLKNKDFNIDYVSLALFRLGLILTAFAMPLEIVPNNFLSLLSWLINILLVQRAIYLFVFKKNKLAFNFKKDSLILAAFTLPLLAIFISALFSFYKVVALLELRGLIVLAVRTLIIIFISRKEDIRLFINSIYIVTVLVIIFAFFQFYADLLGVSVNITRLISNYTSKGTYPFPRVHSFAHEPLYLANYLLIALGLVCGDLVINKEKSKWWIKALFILTVLLIILTVARGAIIGLIFGIFVFLVLTWDFKLFKQILIYSIVSIIISLSVLSSASLIKKDTVINSFGNHAINTKDESVTNRTSTWKYAIKAIIAKPLTGVGGANSQYFIGESNPVDLKNNSTGLYKIIVFNNSFITFLAEYGIIGITSLMPLCYLFIIIGRDLILLRPKSYAVGLFAFTVAVIIQAMTFEIILLLRFWMLLALLIAIWRLDIRSKNNQLNSK